MAAPDRFGQHRSERLRFGGVALLVLIAVLVMTWPVSARSARVIFSGPPASHAVALTFDDGWGEDSCRRIGNTLRRSGARATFFINAGHLRSRPALWRSILRGMPVGNHTRSHVDLRKVSRAVISKEIRYSEAVHEKVLGRPMLKLLRPPYGAYDDRVRRVAANLGYDRLIMWNRTAADSSSAATTSSIIRRTTGAPAGSIILMHCGPAVTARALPAIISHYKSRGIRLIGLDQMLNLDPS